VGCIIGDPDAVFGTGAQRASIGHIVALLLFGAAHCVAWNFEFPTALERLFWRLSSVVTPVLSLAHLCGLHHWGSRRCIWDRSPAGQHWPYRSSLALLLFGGAHCVAWNFEFPTALERLFWRLSSVVNHQTEAEQTSKPYSPHVPVLSLAHLCGLHHWGSRRCIWDRSPVRRPSAEDLIYMANAGPLGSGPKYSVWIPNDATRAQAPE
jgi:hypothetical protein